VDCSFKIFSMAVYLHLFLKMKEATMINILLTLLKITNGKFIGGKTLNSRIVISTRWRQRFFSFYLFLFFKKLMEKLKKLMEKSCVCK